MSIPISFWGPTVSMSQPSFPGIPRTLISSVMLKAKSLPRERSRSSGARSRGDSVAVLALHGADPGLISASQMVPGFARNDS